MKQDPEQLHQYLKLLEQLELQVIQVIQELQAQVAMEEQAVQAVLRESEVEVETARCGRGSSRTAILARRTHLHLAVGLVELVVLEASVAAKARPPVATAAPVAEVQQEQQVMQVQRAQQVTPAHKAMQEQGVGQATQELLEQLLQPLDLWLHIQLQSRLENQ